MSLVTKLSSVLEGRLSRRSFVVRSAFVGSAVTVGGAKFLLEPGSAYASVCYCGSPDCGCGTTCCSGYTEFCCVLDGGYNYCPSDTVMGGWWKADGSVYCDGPRYYMDCNAVCSCTDGCGNGYQFCDTGCDGLTCGCAQGTCDDYLTGCFQFRYGQCNQDVTCLGRIKCRVVTCVPPWEVDPTCTTANAEDDYTANQNAACLTPAPTKPPPPPPPPPPCDRPETRCEVVAMAASRDAHGYGMVTGFGRAFFFGDDLYVGEVHRSLAEPVTAMETCPQGGYWFANGAGRVFAYGRARWHGDAYDTHYEKPIVAMASTPTGDGYWLMTAAGRVVPFGDAGFHGEAPINRYPSPFVAMGATRTGKGYWLLTDAGRVVCCGDAYDHGEAINKSRAPFVALTVTPSGRGYWLATAAGQVFRFGSAGMHGAAEPQKLTYPVVGMASSHTGRGYWLVCRDGQVKSYGDAANYGSPPRS